MFGLALMASGVLKLGTEFVKVGLKMMLPEIAKAMREPTIILLSEVLEPEKISLYVANRLRTSKLVSKKEKVINGRV